MRLVISLAIGAVVLTGFAVSVLAQSQTFTPRDESPEEFAAAPGREEAFYTCTACHNFKLVAQQGMNRRQWEEILTLMYEKHGMPVLDAKDRETVLSYLEAAYPQRAQESGGWRNPFSNQ
jgi:mono/diheme cytochrome c family protein